MRTRKMLTMIIISLFLVIPITVNAENEVIVTAEKEDIKVGENTKVTTTCPEGYTFNNYQISGNGSINENIVTGAGEGNITVTATCSKDGESDLTGKVIIKVTKEEQQEEIKIELSERNLSLKTTDTPKKIEATVTPKAYENSITWSSSDEKVVKVNNGEVTVVGEGEAKITATIEENGKKVSASCTVTVKEAEKKEEKISVNINGAVINPDFNPDITSYTLTITDENNFSIETNGLISDKYKNTKNGDTITIAYGKSSYKFTVVRPNESKNEEIVRPTAYLSKLSVLGYNFNEVFDKENGNGDYKITVGYDITTVTIEAVAEGANYSVTCGSKKLTNTKTTGNTTQFTISNLDIGGTQVVITVTNGTATFKYYVYIERSDKTEVEENTTSIIDDKKKDASTDDSEFDIPDVEDPDTALNMVTVSLASFSLFAMGTLGIYFYMSTSPKRMKKEIIWNNKKNKESQNQSPIVEVEAQNNIVDEKEPTKEYRKE